MAWGARGATPARGGCAAPPGPAPAPPCPAAADEKCPVSTEGGTRRVQLVREKGGGGGGGGAAPAAPRSQGWGAATP